MAKDRKARAGNRLTLAAMANLVAALVDTMREVDVPNDTVHRFLDRLDRLNDRALYGSAWALMAEFVDAVRATVPGND